MNEWDDLFGGDLYDDFDLGVDDIQFITPMTNDDVPIALRPAFEHLTTMLSVADVESDEYKNAEQEFLAFAETAKDTLSPEDLNEYRNMILGGIMAVYLLG